MLSLLQFTFFLSACLVTLLGAVVNWYDKYAPAWILKIYKYGKFSYKGHVSMTFQVPKRWFRHFYVLSSILSFTAFSVLFVIYFKIINGLPPSVQYFLSLLGTQRATVAASRSLLSMFLLMVQCFKRFYETHFVSVFSDSKMDIGHYIIGHVHYIGAILGIFCEAPGTISDVKYQFSYADIGLIHIIAALCFLWACKNQLACAKILGNLRKNEKGKVIHKKHQIPVGGYFELVSSPHLFFEIIMYLCLWIILWGNSIWPFVVLWVVTNQVETSFLTHWWYKETFKNYPYQRKSIIPFVL